MLYIILFGILLWILWYFIEFNEDASSQMRTLQKDGFCICIDKDYLETRDVPCTKLQKDILNKLPRGYVFINYVYKIQDTSLSTFHRDVTSSQNIYHTKHPIYTMILYKYDGELLSVCPRSNMQYPFVFSHITNISGNAGTAFLFDSELLHAGMKNKCKKREIIQYKLCHVDDLQLLTHLSGVNKSKKDICKDGIYESVVRKLSYYLQLPINTLLYPIMIKRENNNFIGAIQSFIPITFYNNV
jgi:hypothetical protein